MEGDTPKKNLLEEIIGLNEAQVRYPAKIFHDLKSPQLRK